MYTAETYILTAPDPDPSAAAPVDSVDGAGASSQSQALKAQLRLRELILTGALPAGARIAELTLVERIGVSRTPIRAALMRLEEEGLVRRLPGGGYAIRVFPVREVLDAIDLRGTLEGLAARLAAERGVTEARLAEARGLLAEIDAVLAERTLDAGRFQRYAEANRRFHALLVEMADSEVVAGEIDRVIRLPFASPNGFVVQQAESAQARDMLVVAQDQHRQVLDAIAGREAGRAEAIMREHARIARRNLQQAMASPIEDRAPVVRLVVADPPTATDVPPESDTTAPARSPRKTRRARRATAGKPGRLSAESRTA